MNLRLTDVLLSVRFISSSVFMYCVSRFINHNGRISVVIYKTVKARIGKPPKGLAERFDVCRCAAIN